MSKVPDDEKDTLREFPGVVHETPEPTRPHMRPTAPRYYRPDCSSLYVRLALPLRYLLGRG